MDRLFIKYSATYNNRNLPNSIENWQFYDILHLTPKNCQRLFKFCQSGQIWSHCSYLKIRSLVGKSIRGLKSLGHLNAFSILSHHQFCPLNNQSKYLGTSEAKKINFKILNILHSVVNVINIFCDEILISIKQSKMVCYDALTCIKMVFIEQYVL